MPYHMIHVLTDASILLMLVVVLLLTVVIPGSLSWLGGVLIILGIVLFMILDNLVQKRNPPWLRRVAYSLLVVTGMWAALALGLQVVDLVQGSIQAPGYFPEWLPRLEAGAFPVLPAVLVLVLSALLWLVLIHWNRPTMMALGVGIPAVLVLNLSLFALAANWGDVWVLHSAGLDAGVAIAFILASLALLIGTIPLGGLLNPLVSGIPKARWMALGGLATGYTHLLVGFILLWVSSQSAVNTPENWPLIQPVYIAGEWVSVLVAGIIIVWGLRAAFFCDQADRHALEQKRLAEQAQRMREINEAIHSTLELDQVFKITVNILGSLTRMDRCIICRYDESQQTLQSPVQEYRAYPGIDTLLDKTFDFRGEYQWLMTMLHSHRGAFVLRADDPALPEAAFHALRHCRVSVCVVCPVTYQNRLIALLVLEQMDGSPPVDLDLALIENLGLKTAIAIHQAELYEEKRLAEVQLQRQLSFVRSVAASLGEGVFALDEQGRVTFFNPAAERLLGWREAEVLGQSVLDKIHATEAAALDQLMTQSRTGEEVFMRQDGTMFPVVWTSAPMSPASGRGGGVIFVFRDITERRRAERELHAYALRLEQSNRDLERFAYVASHDLKAPLIKLQKFSEMLAQTPTLDEEAQDIARRIQASSAKMQGMVADILAMARFSTRNKPFEVVDLNALVQDVLEEYQETLQIVGAQVSVSRLATLRGDSFMLRQLFQNMVDNAIKFRRPSVPLRVQITGRLLNPHLFQFSFQDNGIGFRQEQSTRIFEMFERLHGVSTYEGTGMGLAICQKVVEHHQGQIEAYGQPDEGARFVITLPLDATTLDGRYDAERQATSGTSRLLSGS